MPRHGPWHRSLIRARNNRAAQHRATVTAPQCAAVVCCCLLLSAWCAQFVPTHTAHRSLHPDTMRSLQTRPVAPTWSQQHSLLSGSLLSGGTAVARVASASAHPASLQPPVTYRTLRAALAQAAAARPPCAWRVPALAGTAPCSLPWHQAGSGPPRARWSRAAGPAGCRPRAPCPGRATAQRSVYVWHDARCRACCASSCARCILC